MESRQKEGMLIVYYIMEAVLTKEEGDIINLIENLTIDENQLYVQGVPAPKE